MIAREGVAGEERFVLREWTIDDRQTGLSWERIPSKERYTWSQAMDNLIPSYNIARKGGYENWRVPTMGELCTLIDYTQYAPATWFLFRFSTRSGAYWSSSTYQDFPTLAWYVDFCDGNVGASNETFNFYVRAVRGGA